MQRPSDLGDGQRRALLYLRRSAPICGSSSSSRQWCPFAVQISPTRIQAANRLTSFSASSGALSLHSSIAKGQRGWKLHPAGGFSGDGGSPYTRALVSAVPIPNPQLERQRQRIILQGDPPSPLNPPAGCNFHPRCPFAIAECKLKTPELAEKEVRRFAACMRVGEI
jgi:oligopeptide/dipeptide ABC transporter ATP-binding protein